MENIGLNSELCKQNHALATRLFVQKYAPEDLMILQNCGEYGLGGCYRSGRMIHWGGLVKENKHRFCQTNKWTEN